MSDYKQNLQHPANAIVSSGEPLPMRNVQLQNSILGSLNKVEQISTPKQIIQDFDPLSSTDVRTT